MRKKISFKVLSMLTIVGVLALLTIWLNVNAYVVTEDWLVQLQEHVSEFEESVHAGDLEKAQEVEESVDWVMERLTVKIQGTRIFNKVLILVFTALNVILGVIAYRILARPAKIADKSLQTIIESLENNEGDLTLRVEQLTQDEVGRLVNGINTFIEQLQGILTETKNLSGVMSELSNEISTEVIDSNDNASNISATMEELSASLEEVTATLESITGNVHTVFTSTEVMDDEIKSGQNFVNSMNSVAVETNTYIQKSQQEVINRVTEIRNMLESAIENSKSVEQINSLTDEILDISDQTNLLSLNASIEAARAGQAGRGFSVVAGEISKLSASSKNTANNIQNVNALVSKTVEDLVESASGLLKFIDEIILADYENFVRITNKYQADASNINGIFDKFNELSSGLNDTMRVLTDSIDGINSAIEEGAQGVVLAAESTSSLVGALNTIQANTERNNQVASDLSNQVDRFKNL